jgi:Uma2 family endonuclease
MTDLLELPSVRERVHLLTPEEYHRLGEVGILSEKVKLLRGIVVNKTSKSPLHELVAQILIKVFLKKVPEGIEVRREGPLSLGDSEPEPDLSLVQGVPEDWRYAHPSTALLVVEIAIGSLPLDIQKAEIYAEGGIPEYWIVRPDVKVVDVYREATPRGYARTETFREGQCVLCSSIPEVEVSISDIFA